IVIETQDETFYYLLSDPRDESARMIPSVAHQTNVEAVSLMYRVVDLRALVAGLGDARFGDGTCQVRLAVRDSFVRENDGGFTLSFADGRVRLAETGDALYAPRAEQFAPDLVVGNLWHHHSHATSDQRRQPLAGSYVVRGPAGIRHLAEW